MIDRLIESPVATVIASLEQRHGLVSLSDRRHRAVLFEVDSHGLTRTQVTEAVDYGVDLSRYVLGCPQEEVPGDEDVVLRAHSIAARRHLIIEFSAIGNPDAECIGLLADTSDVSARLGVRHVWKICIYHDDSLSGSCPLTFAR